MTGIAGRPAVTASGVTPRPPSAASRVDTRPLPTPTPVTGIAS
ncbi:hypothetical protein [Streptomyces sp. STR69]|nr:hypothetical protein [Streptomyces sp. STR69]